MAAVQQKKVDPLTLPENRAWIMFNRYLNMQVEWNEARECCLEEAGELKQEFDNDFQQDESDPLRSEAEWTERMNYFDQLITEIKNIPSNKLENNDQQEDAG
jgi:hypothetical protein